MAATPRPSVDSISRACSNDPGERGRARPQDPGRETAHSVNERFYHRPCASPLSVHLGRLTSCSAWQQQSKVLNRYAAADGNTDQAHLDVAMCSESVMETNLGSHMHMCMYCTWIGSSEQASLAPARATSRINGTSPSGPSGDLADARCELRSGLCARPITPSESTRWRNASPRRMQSAVCSLHSNGLQSVCTSLTKRQEGHCDLRTAHTAA